MNHIENYMGKNPNFVMILYCDVIAADPYKSEIKVYLKKDQLNSFGILQNSYD